MNCLQIKIFYLEDSSKQLHIEVIPSSLLIKAQAGSEN